MEINIYSVLDKKAKVYNNPQFLINDAVAERTFRTVVNDKESLVSKYPEDYALYRIGTFDPATGILTPEAYPVPIKDGLHMINSEVK